MKLTLQRCCIGALVAALGYSVGAQEPVGQAIAPGAPTAPAQKAEGLESLSTLDSVRAQMRADEGLAKPNAGSSGMAMGGMTGGMGPGSIMAGPPSAKQLLLQHINQLRLRLNAPDQNRDKLESVLREVLAEYFVLDMEERVREFDKVKARVVQMESKLQARLDQRHELVELQIKQMLYKADGLDFFVPDSGSGGAAMGSGASGGPMSGMVGGPGPGSAFGGFGAGGMDAFGSESGGSSSGGYPGGMAAPSINDSGPAIEIPGYDIGFGMTRYTRFPGHPLEESDHLKSYLALDSNTAPVTAAGDEAKLKALLLAMYNFHDVFNHFPAPANRRDKSEQPHSWRVALLPLLGHADLYKQYHFDEPWDSESNRKLLEKMPAVFGSSDDSNAKLGTTRFQMLVGGGAAFDTSRPTGLQDITDGTANTIALAVASASVPWTKPADIQFVPNKSLAELAPSRLVGLCDGRTETLPANVTEEQLTALVTRSGGEPR